MDNVGITNWAELTTNGMPDGFKDGIDNEGGITVEDDPQVGVIANNYVPRWNGAQLITGNIYNDPAGNVGIGTTGPRGKLELSGSTLSDIILSDKNWWGGVDFPRGRIYSAVDGGLWSDSRLTLQSMSGSGSSYNFIDTISLKNGNVGIGTASPGAKLEIIGGAVGLIINRDGGQLKLTGGAYNGGLWTGGGKLYLANWDTGAGAAVDLSNGNVGIGITPHYLAKLDVNGHAAIRNVLVVGWNPPTPIEPGSLPDFKLGVNGHTYLFGNVYVNWVFVHSDDRLKFNEQKLEYGLAQVMALEPKRYDQAKWEYDPETEEIVIHPETTTNAIGLVAQDVQKVIPEAVSIPENENSQVWSLSYDTIIPVLVKAIQEQQAQIEELKQEIQAIKTGI